MKLKQLEIKSQTMTIFTEQDMPINLLNQNLKILRVVYRAVRTSQTVVFQFIGRLSRTDFTLMMIKPHKPVLLHLSEQVHDRTLSHR